jgi:hypothetical protein
VEWLCEPTQRELHHKINSNSPPSEDKRHLLRFPLQYFRLRLTMSSSIGYHCITPKQQAIVGINDMLPCPPPPRASIQVVEMLVPAQELRDAPPGFFLAAPCNNSSDANDRRVLFNSNRNNSIKLMPKKSGKNHLKLRIIKKNSIDCAVGTAVITRSNPFEGTYPFQALSARSA